MTNTGGIPYSCAYVKRKFPILISSFSVALHIYKKNFIYNSYFSYLTNQEIIDICEICSRNNRMREYTWTIYSMLEIILP